MLPLTRGKERSSAMSRQCEFRLDQTSLQIDANVQLVRSSQGLGWTDLYAAVTRESPHETLHGAVAAIWLRASTAPVDLRRSGLAGELSARLVPHLTSVISAGEPVRDEIRSPMEAMHVYLKQHTVDEIAAEIYPSGRRQRRIVWAIGTDDPVLKMHMTAIRSALDEPTGNALKMHYLSRALAAHLLLYHSTEASGLYRPKPEQTLTTRQLAAVIRHIDANLGLALAVVDLARVAGLGRAQFLRRFKASTLVSPYRYVMERRLHAAQKYLADPQFDLPSIANLCGFSSQAHFSSAFKRALRATPGEYRRALA
jgi:AraC family transcriptional regulator